MRKKKDIIIFFLFFVLICGVTPVVLGIVFSNPQSRVEYDTEGQYYEVNEQGITAIHLQGKIIAASPSNCMFHLAIPQDFEMVYISNGYPILEVVNGGNPLTKTVSEEEFHVVFAVRTYATTVLPRNYSLQITSPQKTFSEIVIPKWLPIDEGGGGAGITAQGPEIYAFWAINTNKGEQNRGKTWIYNPTSYPKTLDRIKYKTTADDYDHWTNKWTTLFGINYSWGPGETLVLHHYYGPIVSAESNRKYAFNTGDFHINEVYVFGGGPGGQWEDYYTPTSTEGAFDISVQQLTHPVFVAHLRDSVFISEFGSGNWLDAVEVREFTVESCQHTHNTKDLFDIDFYSLQLTWEPEEDDVDYLYNHQLKMDAGTLLGLGRNWTIRTGLKGTHEKNHGFDMVIGSSGDPNWVDDGEAFKSCKAVKKGNYAVTMDGWRWWILGTDYDEDKMKLATLHEIFHTYWAEHYNVNGRIMHKWVTSGGWTLSEITETTVENNATHYDGPP